MQSTACMVVALLVLCSLLVWEVMPSQGEARAGEVLVAAGMSSGVVCVWKAVLAEGRLALG